MAGVTYPKCAVQLQVFLRTPSGEASAPVVPPGLDVVGAKASTAARPAHTILFEPRRVRVRRNSYLEADCCEIEVDYKQLPFDPRIARAVAVRVFMRARKSATEGDVVAEENAVFSGYADEGTWELQARGNTIRFEARDLTALLIDRTYSGQSIDWTKPLKGILEDVLKSSPDTAPMDVKFRGGLKDDQPGPGKDRKPGVGSEGNSTTGTTKHSAWDFITGIVQELGLVAWVQDKSLVVGPSQALTENRAADVLKAPLFRWRENIERLRFRVKLSERAPVVQLCSYDPVQAESIVVQWPKQELDKSATGAGVPSPRRTVRLPFAFVSNRQALEDIAKRLYERWESEDLVLRMETREFWQTAEGQEFDLRELRPGAVVRLVINSIDDEYLAAALEGRRLGADDFAAILRKSPYTDMDDQTIAAVAAAYAQLQTLGLYQVLEQELVCDHRDGMTMALEVGSYISADPEAAA